MTDWDAGLWQKGAYPFATDAADCGCHERKGIVCFKHKLRSIQFNVKGKSPTTLWEKRWQQDMDAYKRLRHEGFQPSQVTGCAKIETQADSQLEVEMAPMFDETVTPYAISRKDIAAAEEGMAIAREMGFDGGWTPTDEGAADESKRKKQAGE